MKKILTFLSFIILLFVGFTNVNAAQDGADDLGFLGDIFGDLGTNESTGSTNANPDQSYDPWGINQDNTTNNEPEVDLNSALDQVNTNTPDNGYSPWGQPLSDKVLKSGIVTEEEKVEETLTTQSANEVKALPKTGPTQIILLFMSLIIAGAIFYKRRKSIS